MCVWAGVWPTTQTAPNHAIWRWRARETERRKRMFRLPPRRRIRMYHAMLQIRPDDSFLPWPCSFLPFPPPPTCKTAKPHRARGNASRSVNPSLACLLARTAHRTVYPSSPSYSLQPLLPAVYISALRLAPRSSAIESQPAALGTEPSGVRSAGGAVINWPGRLLKF